MTYFSYDTITSITYLPSSSIDKGQEHKRERIDVFKENDGLTANQVLVSRV